MAIFKPSNISPNFLEVDVTKGFEIECLVHTSGSEINAYQITFYREYNLKDDEDGEKSIIGTIAGNFDRSYVNGEIATISIPGGLTYFKNEENYRYNIRLYQDRILEPKLTGSGAPTSSTEADFVGLYYINTSNNDIYKCTAITPDGGNPETFTYTWEISNPYTEQYTLLQNKSIIPTYIGEGMIAGSTRDLIWTDEWRESMQEGRWIELRFDSTNSDFNVFNIGDYGVKNRFCMTYTLQSIPASKIYGPEYSDTKLYPSINCLRIYTENDPDLDGNAWVDAKYFELLCNGEYYVLVYAYSGDTVILVGKIGILNIIKYGGYYYIVPYHQSYYGGDLYSKLYQSFPGQDGQFYTFLCRQRRQITDVYRNVGEDLINSIVVDVPFDYSCDNDYATDDNALIFMSPGLPVVSEEEQKYTAVMQTLYLEEGIKDDSSNILGGPNINARIDPASCWIEIGDIVTRNNGRFHLLSYDPNTGLALVLLPAHGLNFTLNTNMQYAIWKSETDGDPFASGVIGGLTSSNTPKNPFSFIGYNTDADIISPNKYCKEFFITPNISVKPDPYRPIYMELINDYYTIGGLIYYEGMTPLQINKDKAVNKLDNTQYRVSLYIDTGNTSLSDIIATGIFQPQTKIKFYTQFIDSVPQLFFYARQPLQYNLGIYKINTNESAFINLIISCPDVTIKAQKASITSNQVRYYYYTIYDTSDNSIIYKLPNTYNDTLICNYRGLESGKTVKIELTVEDNLGNITTSLASGKVEYTLNLVRNGITLTHDCVSRTNIIRLSNSEADVLLKGDYYPGVHPAIDMGQTANYDNINIDKNNVLFFQISLSNNLLNMYEIGDIVLLLETEDDDGVKYFVYFDNRPYIEAGLYYINNSNHSIYLLTSTTPVYTWDPISTSENTRTGSGVPTDNTEADFIGLYYINTEDDNIYRCADKRSNGDNPETFKYIWRLLTATPLSGGGAPSSSTSGFFELSTNPDYLKFVFKYGESGPYTTKTLETGSVNTITSSTYNGVEYGVVFSEDSISDYITMIRESDGDIYDKIEIEGLEVDCYIIADDYICTQDPIYRYNILIKTADISPGSSDTPTCEIKEVLSNV